MSSSCAFKLGLGFCLVVSLSQCGGGAEQKTSSPAAEKARTAVPELKVTQDNPCSILFPSEVGDIVGAAASLREIMDEITCRYHFEPGPGSSAKSEGGETFVEIKMYWTGGPAVVASRSSTEKLEGVGDAAWWDAAASHLVFSKGDAGAEIDMRMMPDREKAIRIAQLMASRL